MPTLERDSSLRASALCLAERWWCRSVTHSYPEWTGLVDFAFHGRNTYAYLLAKYGKTLIPPAGGGAPRAAETYDLVSIQLYESFSHADFAISVEKARFPAQVPSPSPVAHASRDLQGTHRSGAPLPSRSKPRHICCILCER